VAGAVVTSEHQLIRQKPAGNTGNTIMKKLIAVLIASAFSMGAFAQASAPAAAAPAAPAAAKEEVKKEAPAKKKAKRVVKKKAASQPRA
jgi:Ni/Co efflux regulator RcnB